MFVCTGGARVRCTLLRLSIVEGLDAGTSFLSPADEPQLIGRSSEALPITDTTVSRRHAEMTPDAAIELADRAMYAAKHGGRDRCSINEAMELDAA